MSEIDLTDPNISSVDLYIPSSARTQGTVEDFNYIVGDAPITDIIGYRINKVRVPDSVYTVEAPYINSHILNEGAGDLTVSVADGFYIDIADFVAAWKAALDAASTLPQVYTVSYSAITAKFTVSAAAPFVLDFTASPFAILAGYEIGEITPSAVSQTSTNLAESRSPNIMFVESSQLSNSTLSGHSIENHKPSNIICMVSRDTSERTAGSPYLLPDSYEAIQATREFQLYNLDLRLKFPSNFIEHRPVNLNGIEWAIWITLYYHRHPV